MVLFEGVVGYAIALLLGLALAEYAKVRKSAEKPLTWIAAGAVLFLLTGIFGLQFTLFTIPPIVAEIVQILGFIAVLVGGLWATYELIFG